MSERLSMASLAWPFSAGPSPPPERVSCFASSASWVLCGPDANALFWGQTSENCDNEKRQMIQSFFFCFPFRLIIVTRLLLLKCCSF